MAGLEFGKIFDTNLNTPQMVVIMLVGLYVFGGMYFVIYTKAKAKTD